MLARLVSFCTTLVAVVLLAGVAPSQAESWAFRFDFKIAGTMAGTQVDISGGGTGSVTAGEDGRYTGKAELAVTTTPTVSVPGISFTPAKGSGSVEVEAIRKGEHLVISLARKSIAQEGEIVTAAGRNPWKTTFETSSIAPAGLEALTTIERRIGATTTSRHSGGGLSATITFTLTAGSDIQPPEEPAPARSGNLVGHPLLREKVRWELTLESVSTTRFGAGAIQGVTVTKLDAVVPFELAPVDLAVKAEGSLTFRAVTTGFASADMKGEGVFELDARIEDDHLVFVPRARLTSSSARSAAGSARSDHGAGVNFFTTKDEVRLPLRNDAEVAVPTDQEIPGGTHVGACIWRLKGKKVEVWRMIQDEKELVGLKNRYGFTGVRIRWRHTVDFRLVDGQYDKSIGQAELISTEPVCEPSGDPLHPEKARSVQLWDVALLHMPHNGRETPYITPASFVPVRVAVTNGSVDLTLADTGGGVAWTRAFREEQASELFPGKKGDYEYWAGPFEREFTGNVLVPNLPLIDGYTRADDPTTRTVTRGGYEYEIGYESSHRMVRLYP